MVNYTWSRTIDDGGTFRSGYAIPAAYSNTGKAWTQDAIERSVSTSNQPHHFVFTGVENLPFGTGHLGGGHAWTRALFRGLQVLADSADELRVAIGNHRSFLPDQPGGSRLHAHNESGLRRISTRSWPVG